MSQGPLAANKSARRAYKAYEDRLDADPEGTKKSLREFEDLMQQHSGWLGRSKGRDKIIDALGLNLSQGFLTGDEHLWAALGEIYGKGNEIRAAKDIFAKLEKGSNERANREDSLLASARSKTNLSEGAFNTLMESGRYWKSPDGTKSRRYFDSEDVLKAKGYRVERSGRGFATIYDQDGDKVSNSKAARLKSDADGVYYDYTDGTFKQGRNTYSF